MRGTASARESMVHDLGSACAWPGSRGPCSGTGADGAASCTDVMCSPFPWTCEHSNESTHLGGLDD
ncbi:hypothetical protein GCM10009647_090610 [Streptomyces sanglieri]